MVLLVNYIEVVFSPGGKLVATGSSDKRRGVFHLRALALAVTAFTMVRFRYGRQQNECIWRRGESWRLTNSILSLRI